MTQVLAEILKEVDQLSAPEKAELANHLAERLGGEIPPEIEHAQLDVVKRRIAEVESGEIELISGEVASARVLQAISQAAP